MSPRKSNKEEILDAAEKLVAEVGAVHMTLDAVSARAGVSKGGLLYHFPSKDDLIRGMIQRHSEIFEAARLHELESLPDGPARELKAHVLSWLRQDEETKRISAALLAAAANNPALLHPVRKTIQELSNTFAHSGLSKERAAIIFMAVEGARIYEIWGLTRFTPEEARAMADELLKLAEP